MQDRRSATSRTDTQGELISSMARNALKQLRAFRQFLEMKLVSGDLFGDLQLTEADTAACEVRVALLF